jgi:hypothetical protein
VTLASIVRNAGRRGTTYTVRYRDSAGKSCQESFKSHDAAKARKAELDNAAAKGDVITTAQRKTLFSDLMLQRINRERGRTRETYMTMFRRIVAHYGEQATLADVANDRAKLEELCNTVLFDKSRNYRGQIRMIVTSSLDMAQAHGMITAHRCSGIELTEREVAEAECSSDDEGEVRVLSDMQCDEAAAKLGIIAVLQRRLGLRISEARGVRTDDFTDDFAVLRLRWQATRDGRSRVPLKARRAHQGRDIPVPEDVRKILRDMPEGPLCPGKSTTYVQDSLARSRYAKLGMKSHDLRHTFASRSLEKGMPIQTLSRILGHQSIAITLNTYVHETPEQAANALEFMA